MVCRIISRFKGKFDFRKESLAFGHRLTSRVIDPSRLLSFHFFAHARSAFASVVRQCARATLEGRAS
jgi:hypothetical protein